MYKSIQPVSAYDMIEQDTVTIVDIRDSDAQHVSGENLEKFVETSDFNQPLLVYCYHGNSSQPAAAYFGDRGFEDVYHLVGGFESWRSSNLPIVRSTN